MFINYTHKIMVFETLVSIADRGVPRILPGGCTFLAPDPHQDFELDPDPDPHQNNADPQPWAVLLIYFTRTVLISACSILEIKRLFFIYNDTRQKNYQIAGKQTCIFFLLPTASSFLLTSLSGWGGCTWPGGGMHRGVGGMHVHPAHPPWVRP